MPHEYDGYNGPMPPKAKPCRHDDLPCQQRGCPNCFDPLQDEEYLAAMEEWERREMPEREVPHRRKKKWVI